MNKFRIIFVFTAIICVSIITNGCVNKTKTQADYAEWVAKTMNVSESHIRNIRPNSESNGRYIGPNGVEFIVKLNDGAIVYIKVDNSNPNLIKAYERHWLFEGTNVNGKVEFINLEKKD